MDLLAIFSVFSLSLLLAMAGASAGLKAALYLIAHAPQPLPLPASRHDRREFLDAFPAIDFARVDVAPRVDADRVREVQLPR